MYINMLNWLSGDIWYKILSWRKTKVFKVDEILSWKKRKYIDCALYSFLCFFVLMKSYRKKKKTDLITSSILLLIISVCQNCSKCTAQYKIIICFVAIVFLFKSLKVFNLSAATKILIRIAPSSLILSWCMYLSYRN